MSQQPPHSYSSIYPPNTPVLPGIKQFFEDFYRVSDTLSLEIMATRKAMWTSITSRLHTPEKIFPFGPDSNEVMIFGTVVYGFGDGRPVEVKEWAGHARLVDVGGIWKFGYYRVYLDMAPAKAKAE